MKNKFMKIITYTIVHKKIKQKVFVDSQKNHFKK